LTFHKTSYIKIVGWIGAISAAILSCLTGDIATAVGIIAAASTSSNLAK